MSTHRGYEKCFHGIQPLRKTLPLRHHPCKCVCVCLGMMVDGFMNESLFLNFLPSPPRPPRALSFSFSSLSLRVGFLLWKFRVCASTVGNTCACTRGGGRAEKIIFLARTRTGSAEREREGWNGHKNTQILRNYPSNNPVGVAYDARSAMQKHVRPRIFRWPPCWLICLFACRFSQGPT